MSAEGFIFDYAKCVGCHACIVACHVENKTKPPIAWRQINSFNPKKIPLAGFLHLSIACNHCIDAPCIKACPARAYVKDELTKAVIHYSERCIGCKYCTWACPYDAPIYNINKGVVEKCHLCNHLISNGLIPACVKQCPTGALSFGLLNLIQDIEPIGLPISTYQPRIRTIRTNIIESIPLLDYRISGFDTLNKSIPNKIKTKINAKDEWSLVLFTLIFAILAGWLFSFKGDSSIFLKIVFLTISAIGILLSAFHLGKPLKAPRAIINVKTSWLSREILLCGLFFTASLLYFFFLQSLYMLIITSLISVLLLISVEMVYSIPQKKYKTTIHSSNTILTAFLFGFLFTEQSKLLVLVITVKALLYIFRYGVNKKNFSLKKMLIVSARIILGLLFPMSIVLFSNQPYSDYLLLCLIFGETVDRFEFYNDIYIDTPIRILDQTINAMVEKK